MLVKNKIKYAIFVQNGYSINFTNNLKKLELAYSKAEFILSYSSDISECIKLNFPKLNLRNTGCAALDLAYVGCGRFDGYFHDKINLWDVAAGKIIIEEAGGKVNNINNYKINQIDIRAGNSNIYEKMLQKIGKF